MARGLVCSYVPRRTQAGLNKGEPRNALARSRFFNQFGELRVRRFENQTYCASGLNLLVAAIILWNTRYLEQAAGALAIPEDIARHIAPLGWEHISLTGEIGRATGREREVQYV